ncbi:MAG TPA: hypothetical protein VD701_08030 [Steroidobacteraceae bacterium]|nr:hypothetical protein [Steroidobacteraceae bacterium]
MAKLEDRGQRGLPPAPAPTRRGANPWRLSDTARKREALPPGGDAAAQELLEALFSGKQQEQATPATLQPPPPEERRPQGMMRSRRKSGFWPLLVLLLIAGVLVKLVLEARESGDWRELIPAIFAILFIAHAIWRSRRRQQDPAAQDEARHDRPA